MSLSPTQRTLRALRDQGRLCAITERWQVIPGHPGGGVRRDLWGWCDLISLDPERGIVGIQSCGQSFAAHVSTILDSEATQFVVEWLKCNGRVELWGWRKVKVKRGGKAMRWAPRIREFFLADFEDRKDASP